MEHGILSILLFMYGVWNFVNTSQVYLHDKGYFIFRFDTEDDKNKVIQQGPYTFQNRPMILKQWEPDFQLSKELTRNVPIWVIFPSLPIQFWSKENLGRIASYLEKLICSDKLTANCDRISYARILIEMDISQKLPDSLMIEVADGKYKEQMLECEWKPAYCEECLQLGQHTESCTKVQQAQRQVNQQHVKPKKQQKKKQQAGQWRVKIVNEKDQKEKEDSPEPHQEENIDAEYSQQKRRGKQIMKDQGQINRKGHCCLETKIKPRSVAKVRAKFSREWKVYSDETINERGWIWILWKEQLVQVNIILFSDQLVHCKVKDKSTQNTFDITFVYGKNTIAERRNLWGQLRQIQSNIQEAWLLTGDFNNMLSVDDRINGQPVQQAELWTLRDV
ncbi:uncharacterized protein [Nicotiana sylvestris]|uniref:uncharacterized protein n=1 Tax=Nicotiana sylvestris TaxID=4096 RepID=UPI00388CC38E